MDSSLQRMKKQSRQNGCLIPLLCLWLLFNIPTSAYAGRIVFSIQIGAYRELRYASEEIDKLKKSGLDVFYRHEDAGKKGKLYRVYIEKYQDKKGAEKAAQELKQHRVIEDYIIKTIQDGEAFSPPLVIKKITLNQNKRGTEKLLIHSTGFFWPSVLFSLEEDRPRLVIHIPNAVTFEKSLSKHSFKGDLIKAIRNPSQKKENNVDLILDLATDRKYEVTQNYDEAENIFSLIFVLKSDER